MTTVALLVLAAVIALAMLAETWLVIHLRRQSGEIEQRSAALQRQVSLRQMVAERRRAGPAQAALGLPAGSLMNDFELPTLGGGNVTGSQWRGERIAVIFVQHDCPYSRRVIEALTRLEPAPVRLLFATTGGTDVNRELFAGAPDRVSILLQDELELARVWRVQRSPAMYLLDERGITDGPMRVGFGEILTALDLPMSPSSMGMLEAELDLDGSSPFSVQMPLSTRPLAAGQLVPDLPVTLLDGEETSVSAGRSTVVLVMDLRCAVCRAGLASLAGAVREVASEHRVLALSWGDEPEARNLAAAFGPDVAVSVQFDTRLLRRLGMVSAPAAVLLDGAGTALTDTAVGTAAILALVETVTMPVGTEAIR